MNLRPTLTLDPYQVAINKAIKQSFQEGHTSVVLCAPPGAGKTVMFTDIVKQMAVRKKHALILTDRNVLCEQVQSYGIDSMTAQLAWSQKIDLSKYDAVIFDEAHEGIFTKLFNRTPPKFCIGATATPTGKHMKKMYSKIIQEVEIDGENVLITPEYLQGVGRLVLCKARQRMEVKGLKKQAGEYTEASQFAAMDKPRVYDGVVEDWFEYERGNRTLVYAINIEHAEKLAKAFGSVARCVHSKCDNPKDIIDAHKRGEFPVLINVGMLTKGYDDPLVQAVQVVRSTDSLALWHQMGWRGGRWSEGKTEFRLYDYGGNHKRLGRIDATIRWQFQDEKLTTGAAPVKMCKHCDGVNYASAVVCECCGEAFPVKVVEPVETVLEDVPLAERKQLSKMSVGELIQRENMGVVKRQYVWRVLSWRPKADVEEYRKRRGYVWGWTSRWLNKKLVFFDKIC